MIDVKKDVKYNCFFIETGSEDGESFGVKIYTHHNFELKKEDIYINSMGLCVVLYPGIHTSNDYSQFLCEDLDKIKVYKIEEECVI